MPSCHGYDHDYDCVHGHANESENESGIDCVRVRVHEESRNHRVNDCDFADSRLIDSSASIYSQRIGRIDLNVNVNVKANGNANVHVHVHDDY